METELLFEMLLLLALTAAGLAHANRLPMLLLCGDGFLTRLPDPVLQQMENYGDPTFGVNDAFKPVVRYWDRITHPAQGIQSMPAALATLTGGWVIELVKGMVLRARPELGSCSKECTSSDSSRTTSPCSSSSGKSERRKDVSAGAACAAGGPSMERAVVSASGRQS